MPAAATTRQMADAIRILSLDAVEKARSGHLGLPLGMADVATVLFTEFLKFDAARWNWPDRDRFVLSAGHGSMLLYSLLHLTGYESVRLADIRNFRQLGSRTPGHPENFVTAGVETTTGPLGQGIATAVGMAIAERHLNARFGDDLVDHRTYVLAGDGCLMEGISQEAITLAGHLELSRLIVLFDDNEVTIDGSTSIADSTDQCARFEASGWTTTRIDGHDPAAIRTALAWAQLQQVPVMIACKTLIGFGAPNLAGTGKAHGGPYGPVEAEGVRAALGWAHPPFEIPDHIATAWRLSGARFANDVIAWDNRLAASLVGRAFRDAMAGDPPTDLAAIVAAHKQTVVEIQAAQATRQWSGAALEVLTQAIPEMVGGSADLTGSNNTRTSHTLPMSPADWSGRYLHYGVREHGMAAAMNGMAVHGGVLPYSGTFLVFADYSRAALRLGALMGAQVIHVMTHDSIGLGEDGPTHQPIEHLASLRAIPNMLVFRPCDGVEAVECWEAAIRNTSGPSTLALTRQAVRGVRTTANEDNLSARGAYIISPSMGSAQAVILATGSEVEIAIEAQEKLIIDGISVRVVSMPCMELFEVQDEAYQAEVLGSDLPVVAIEAGVRFGWDRWIGKSGAFVGMKSFGASAPAESLYQHFEITAEAVIAKVRGRCQALSAQT